MAVANTDSDYLHREALEHSKNIRAMSSWDKPPGKNHISDFETFRGSSGAYSKYKRKTDSGKSVLKLQENQFKMMLSE